MQISQEVIDFINDSENKKLLNDFKFKKLYEKLDEIMDEYDDGVYISEFTALMYKAGLDPLQYLDEVPKDFLYENESIESLEIPNNIASIGFCAFGWCSSLTSITIPDSVTAIDWRAFSGCSSLTNVTIGNGVTSISKCAFYDCTSLTSVTIGNNVAYIDEDAFGGCSKLTSITYKGTIEDWKNIRKGSDWNKNVPKTCIVHCTDGDTLMQDEF